MGFSPKRNGQPPSRVDLYIANSHIPQQVTPSRADSDPTRRYYAGALLLDLEDPARVRYQAPEPVLAPQTAEETEGR